ncbi:hypothetical protein QGM71_09815 [Virgibacillus sp. C22-A2]|uniref:Uncharacterized protein n=2 Tax=Virgibacillus tibetensis TaxID=3042313 RepID=A0ABU6KEP4_9BACI|nr:hypothetical protein [Virgibacillus sp. C22-A2]
MVISVNFPHNEQLGDTILAWMNIPTRFSNGIQLVGMAGLFLFLVSFYLLYNSLGKYRGRMLILTFILAGSIPPFLIETYQKTAATGIYAVSYEKESSSCDFELADKTTLHGNCDLSFENLSNKDVTFLIEFKEHFSFDGYASVTLMNKQGPYSVKLKAKEHRNMKIKGYIDVSDEEKHINNGTTHNPDIKIIAGDKFRNL